jgi:alpha-galactosidase
MGIQRLGRSRVTAAAVVSLGLLAAGFARSGDRPPIESPGLRLEFDDQLHARVVAKVGEREAPLGPFAATETVATSTGAVRDFAFVRQQEHEIADAFGAGRRFVITGRSGAIEKSVSVSLYEAFPRTAVLQVRYTNVGVASITLTGWTNHHYEIDAAPGAPAPAFWSYQSGSYKNRPDWVLPLTKGFRQRNYLGMNASDYGGGTPVVDVWRRDVGLGIGHLELVPQQVSLPVACPSAARASLAVEFQRERRLQPGESFDTLRTFVTVHRGDHFETLLEYRRMMQRQGVVLPTAPASAFEPIWCAWGYGRHFVPDQVVETLPVARRLGFGWATLDDGWQVAEGDWVPVPKKFPHGDADMRTLVDDIHKAGLKAQLWWAPLAADPGSALLASHPDELLLDAQGKRRKISWWDSFYLCPADSRVRQDARALVTKFLVEWGFDGLKIDGQHLNGAPPCFNPAHHHLAPEDAVAGLPGFFKAIWEAALAARADAIVEICPCGTSYSFFTLPYLNMTVASDPESSWQVRHKGKTLKALHGDGIAFFGDHVEMSDGGKDFASTVGVGGVIGSNFAWPGAPGKKDAKLLLTPQRERVWERWSTIYRAKRLPEGAYLGTLYDIGFDRPEAHAIRKARTMYYAFFAPSFAGEVELRGLEAVRYRIRDYEHENDLGTLSGPSARLAVTFADHLLIEAAPE